VCEHRICSALFIFVKKSGTGCIWNPNFTTLFYKDNLSMARANLNKSKNVLTSTTSTSKYVVHTQKAQNLYQLKSPPFRPHFIKFSKTVFYEVNLVSQCSHLSRGTFTNWIWICKGGIPIDADSGPLGYVLWCCGSISEDFYVRLPRHLKPEPIILFYKDNKKYKYIHLKQILDFCF
jgi:hypothetical protein